MEVAKSFHKTLKVTNNNVEYHANIDIKDSSLFITIKHSQSPLLDWTYKSNYEQITKSFPALYGCESLYEVADVLVETIAENNYSIESNDTGLCLTIDLKLFKKKLIFNLILNEIKDPKAIIMELSQILAKMSINSSKAFYMGSDVLLEEEFEMMRKWIDPIKQVKLNLLYKAKDEGFGSNIFHSKCDGKYPTIVLAESNFKKRFGGVAFIAWNSGGAYTKDANAFLFSLTHKLKFKENGANSNSIYGNNGYGPTFGGGHDLYFANSCGINFTSYSSLGTNYSKDGIGNINNQCVLAGNYNFMVISLEVYQIELV